MHESGENAAQLARRLICFSAGAGVPAAGDLDPPF
jgi:hypothetical protein